MSTVRVIKKYPNRRLYDTEKSCYITLADVRGLVLDRVEFTVIDKKSGEDITRIVLLQVISEQEQQGEAIMTEAFLSQVIRSYGNAVSDFIASYLEQSLGLLLTQPQNVPGPVQPPAGIDPVAPVADIAQMNFSRWKSLQDEPLQRRSGAARNPLSVDETSLRENCKKAG